MPKTINIGGIIIPNDDKWIYDCFDIENITPKDVQSAINEANGEDITVVINSNGGDVFAGSEIYDLIANYKGNVLIRVVGIAASAASVIACAGPSEIAPTAMIMIHNVSSHADGDYREMEHSAEALKNCNKSIAAAYMRKTGMTEAELLSMMDYETYITAEQAVEKGFIDKIADYSKEAKPKKGIALAASLVGLLPTSTIQKVRASRAQAQANLNLIKLNQKGE